MREVKLLENGFENTLQVGQDVVIPESNDVISAFLQRHRAFVVRNHVFAMLATIDLDNQLSAKGDKINDESGKGDLPFEFDSVELTRTKLRPKQALGFGLILAEDAGVPSHRLSPLTLPSPQWGEGHFT